MLGSTQKAAISWGVETLIKEGEAGENERGHSKQGLLAVYLPMIHLVQCRAPEEAATTIAIAISGRALTGNKRPFHQCRNICTPMSEVSTGLIPGLSQFVLCEIEISEAFAVRRRVQEERVICAALAGRVGRQFKQVESLQ